MSDGGRSGFWRNGAHSDSVPINYGPDPEPEGVDLEGRPYWGNGRAPGSVRQRRRLTIAMLNTLARMLYEGERFE